MAQPRIIFFVGKPGSGKGTQAKLLSERTGWPVVGTSAGLRDIVASGSTIAHRLKAEMDAGILTPHWMVEYVYFKTLVALPEDEGVIFDGTSRTLPEAKVVLESLRWANIPFAIVHLATDDEEVRGRIALRKDREGRVDDHEHVVSKRIEEFYAQTQPAIDYFKQEGVLTDIHGEGAPEEIAANVRAVLGFT